jgi:hypothetical protein
VGSSRWQQDDFASFLEGLLSVPIWRFKSSSPILKSSQLEGVETSCSLLHRTAIHRGYGKNRLRTVDNEDRRHAESLLKQVKRIINRKAFSIEKENRDVPNRSVRTKEEIHPATPRSKENRSFKSLNPNSSKYS